MKTFKIIAFMFLLLSCLYFSAHAAMIGETAYIVTSMNYPHVAVDEAGFDAYMKAIVSNDVQYGITELYQKGKLFQVENNVKVTILDKKLLGKVKVRILEGKKKGSSGWVAAEWIKDQPPRPTSSTGLNVDCSMVKITNTFPNSIPKGFNKEQKTKYRVVTVVIDDMITIMDANKIGNPSGCTMKMYAPIYFQEYFFKDGYFGVDKVAKKRWYHRIHSYEYEFFLYNGKDIAIIQK